MVRAIASLLPLSVLLLTACGSPVEPTLSSIQANVFEGSCVFSGCHDAGAGGNLVLTSAAESRAALVGVTPDDADAQNDGYLRVEAGNPDNSYLYVLLVEDLVPEYAELMPKNSLRALPDDEIDAIREWIEDGALDN